MIEIAKKITFYNLILSACRNKGKKLFPYTLMAGWESMQKY